MTIDFNQFRCTGGDFSLRDMPTEFDGGMNNDDLKDACQEVWDEVDEWHERLYAEGKQSLLIVFQAMDAAGKDSSIGKLTSALSAHGCYVKAFKKPSTLELSHDFLWRVHQAAPSAGHLALFNRSHYEDVLVVKVHGWADDEIIERRYDHINNFERLLADRGTRVVKFMLNISKDYQLERFKSRLENSEKHWKFNPGDLFEREHWDDYMSAFETAIQRCASKESPWYIVPAQNRTFRDLMVASVIRDTLRDMNPQYPAPDFDPTEYTVDSIS